MDDGCANCLEGCLSVVEDLIVSVVIIFLAMIFTVSVILMLSAATPTPHVDDQMALVQLQAQARWTLPQVINWDGSSPRIYMVKVGNRSGSMTCMVENSNTVCLPVQLWPNQR